MKFSDCSTVGQRLFVWLGFQNSNAPKETTRRYNRQLAACVRNHFPDLDLRANAVPLETMTEFILSVAHYCDSRFNAIVSLFKILTPAAAEDLRRRKYKPKTVNLPTQAEFAGLLRELDARPRSHVGLCVRFLALTGLRINEARQIEWRDVSERGIFVRPEISKNGKARSIPFIGEVQSVLDRLRNVSTSSRVLPQAECKRSLATACSKAGIARMTHHDMRRLFATRCIESGVDVPTVAKWLGHSDGGALLGKAYFHLLDEHAQAMASRVRIAA